LCFRNPGSSPIAHSHSHSNASGRKVWLALFVTLTFCAGEAVVGLITHSLALISDAGHNFGDAIAMGLSGYAAWIAIKPATTKFTYGYHRATILAPLFNAATLVVTALVIGFAAIDRLASPVAVLATPMIWTAAAAMIMNAAVALFLAGEHSLNDRSVFIHIVGDALSSLAVVVAGVVIHYTGWLYVDPIVSLGIAVFILYSASGILRQTIGILMENTPPGMDLNAVAASIVSVTPVQAVHHLHVWAIRDGMNALSCHVTLPDECTLKDCSATIAAINMVLYDQFDIHHATIQTELEGDCAPTHEGAMLCVVDGHSH
jgi:cobalt-zinc-cadmium efflux system protein